MNTRILYVACLFLALLALLVAAGLSIWSAEPDLPGALVSLALMAALVCMHLKFRTIGLSMRRHTASLHRNAAPVAVPNVTVPAPVVDMNALKTSVDAATARALASHDSMLFAELLTLRRRLNETLTSPREAPYEDRSSSGNDSL